MVVICCSVVAICKFCLKNSSLGKRRVQKVMRMPQGICIYRLERHKRTMPHERNQRNIPNNPFWASSQSLLDANLTHLHADHPTIFVQTLDPFQASFNSLVSDSFMLLKYAFWIPPVENILSMGDKKHAVSSHAETGFHVVSCEKCV